ncbi:MAG TPA: copper homeostasis membrane protein CopD [Usitatibacter sp.]|nr:copper homeostasis membrane protein CopD [Usitatibacter sp.]
MDLALAIVRAAHLAAAIALFGQLAFRHAVSPGRARPPRFGAVAGWSLAVAGASAIAWLGIEAQEMSGLALREALMPRTLGMVLARTLFGELWLARMAILALLAASIAILSREKRDEVPAWAWLSALVLALVLLATVAGTGHAAAARGTERAVRLVVDGLHLLAAGAWLGALPPLVLVIGAAMREGDAGAFDHAREATRRFSALGIASVGTLLLSGVINATYTLHGFAALLEPGYGMLLAAKLALFLVMVGFAAVNRMWLTPRLAASAGQARASLRIVRRNAIVELVLGIGIVCIVGQLGITMPATPARVE